MVLNGERSVCSWQATDNVPMPRLHRAWQEIAYASALTVAPDQSGVCGVVSCPASRSPSRLGRARRACGLRAGDALPFARGAGGIHQLRPGWPAGAVKLVMRVTGWVL